MYYRHLCAVGAGCVAGLWSCQFARAFGDAGQLTAEALESLWGHSTTLADVVRTQFVDDTGNGHGVGEKLCGLSHLSVLVERIEVSCVQICIPAGHVHEDLFHLGLSELELLEESPTTQIMIVLVRLAQYVADFQMCLVVVRPVLLAAVNRYPAVWALEIYMGWWGALLRRLTSLKVHGILCGSSRLMIRMRAVRMLTHERRSFADLRYG